MSSSSGSSVDLILEAAVLIDQKKTSNAKQTLRETNQDVSGINESDSEFEHARESSEDTFERQRHDIVAKEERRKRRGDSFLSDQPNEKHNENERKRRKMLKHSLHSLRDQLRKKTRRPAMNIVLTAAYQEIQDLKQIEDEQCKLLDELKQKNIILNCYLDKQLKDIKLKKEKPASTHLQEQQSETTEVAASCNSPISSIRSAELSPQPLVPTNIVSPTTTWGWSPATTTNGTAISLSPVSPLLPNPSLYPQSLSRSSVIPTCFPYYIYPTPPIFYRPVLLHTPSTLAGANYLPTQLMAGANPAAANELTVIKEARIPPPKLISDRDVEHSSETDSDVQSFTTEQRGHTFNTASTKGNNGTVAEHLMNGHCSRKPILLATEASSLSSNGRCPSNGYHYKQQLSSIAPQISISQS